ncbi:enoyl-CoA hydratase/isomerase family protein [Paracoccus aerius]
MTIHQKFEYIGISENKGVVTITMNRPEVRNAINDQMRAELISAFDAAGADLAVRAVILTGAGKGFCSGGTLAECAPGLMPRQAR